MPKFKWQCFLVNHTSRSNLDTSAWSSAAISHPTHPIHKNDFIFNPDRAATSPPELILLLHVPSASFFIFTGSLLDTITNLPPLSSSLSIFNNNNTTCYEQQPPWDSTNKVLGPNIVVVQVAGRKWRAHSHHWRTTMLFRVRLDMVVRWSSAGRYAVVRCQLSRYWQRRWTARKPPGVTWLTINRRSCSPSHFLSRPLPPLLHPLLARLMRALRMKQTLLFLQ